jgi:hypothetical protein
MFSSSVPALKAALMTRIEAALATAGKTALVSRGNPYPKAWAGQTVIIGKATIDPPVRVVGMTQENEYCDVEVFINAAGNAQDAYSVFEDRAYALRDVIESDLRDWTMAPETLPAGSWGQVLSVLAFGGSDQEGIETDKNGAPRSRDCTVTLTVRVQARKVSYG